MDFGVPCLNAFSFIIFGPQPSSGAFEFLATLLKQVVRALKKKRKASSEVRST